MPAELPAGVERAVGQPAADMVELPPGTAGLSADIAGLPDMVRLPDTESAGPSIVERSEPTAIKTERAEVVRKVETHCTGPKIRELMLPADVRRG